jgi:hypothetical protein
MATSVQRADAPKNYWHRGAKAIELGRFEFRLTAIREGRKHPLSMDQVVEAVSWESGDRGLLTGSITVHKTERGRFDVRVGDTILLEYSLWGQNHWQGLWRMALTQPEYQINGRQYVFQLEDDLLRLSRSKATLHFRQDKVHPHGWRADEAIRRVCREFDVPVGRIPRMKRRIKKRTFVKQSPLTIIADMLKAERTETGHRYFIRWTGGKVNIVPFQRSDYLMNLGGFILDGTLVETQKDSFATVLDLVAVKDASKGKDSKGNKKHAKHKLRTTVRASPKLIRQYGIVKQTVHHNDADSVAELRKWGKRELARRVKVKRDFSFTHPGYPTLRTGDAIRVHVPSAGLNHVICFVGSVSHSVQPGSYTMDVTVQFSDPYIDKKAERVARKKAAAARERARKSHASQVTRAQQQSKAKKASQRS